MFCSATMAQTWVTLTQREPATPEITLNRSNNQEVNFTIGLPGFFSTSITESGNGFLQYDKAFEKPAFIPGKVKWISITNPAQADTLSCDYLIVICLLFFSTIFLLQVIYY